MNDIDALYSAIEKIYQDPKISGAEFFDEFRRSWDRVIKKAAHSGESYMPEKSSGIYTASVEFMGLRQSFHFNQPKIYDWYQNETARKSKNIFVAKKLRRRRGKLMLDESVCRYESGASEAALDENMKNICACALPGVPPELCVVYGNKWVDGKFTAFRRNTLSLYFINTDYTPAFLGTPLEVAMYLFLMDCGFIIFNSGAVKDRDIKAFLHIFRPSPMLTVKGLIN